ncbi:MAG: hypothetical protein AB8E15_11050 [Bdellovibrionales bacterium]
MNLITTNLFLSILILSGHAHTMNVPFHSKKVHPNFIQCVATNLDHLEIHLDVEYYRTDGYSGPGSIEFGEGESWGTWSSSHIDEISRLNGQTEFQFLLHGNNDEKKNLSMNLIFDPIFKTGFGSGNFFDKTVFLDCKYE